MRTASYTAEEFEVMRDGLRLVGTKFVPAKPNGIPVIISHGFLGRRRDIARYAKCLAVKGCTAYTFDFAGGSPLSESDGRLQDMSVLTERADLMAVMDYVKRDLAVDYSKLVLMGYSQGGFVSALTAAARPEEVHKLALFSPALCIPDDARSGQMMFFQFDPQNVPDTVSAMGGRLTIGRGLIETAQALDAMEAIAPYKGPVLIAHGTADHIVNVSYAQRAKAAYGDNAQLLLVEGADHGFKRFEDVIAKPVLRKFVLGT